MNDKNNKLMIERTNDKTNEQWNKQMTEKTNDRTNKLTE